MQKATYHMISPIQNFQNRQIHGDGKYLNGCEGLEAAGKRGVTENECRIFGCDENILKLD